MSNDFIKKFNEKMDAALDVAKKAREDDERRRLISTVGQDMAALLAPFLQQVAESTKFNKEMMGEMMQVLRAEVADSQMRGVDTTPIIAAIESALGGVQMPEPKVTVTVPDFKIPDIKMPEEMAITGWVKLMANRGEVGHDNPLPVMLMDRKGNPINLFDSIPQAMSSGGSGGGKADFFTIKGFSQSAYSDLMNADGRLRVSVETGGSGLTDAEIRATALPVSQVSGAVWSVIVNEIFGSIGTNVINPDGRIKVELPTGSSGLTDSELRATAVPVSQVSGVAWSVSVNDIFGSVGANVINPDNRVSVQLPENPLPVYQVSGASFSIQATDIFSTLAASTVVNPDNRVRVELPATTVTVGSVTATIASANVDSTGVQYSGSNPMPVYLVLGSGNSTISVGPTLHDAVDDGAAPQKMGGTAVQANPTAVSGGDIVRFTADDLGRQLTRPVNARDLILTARVSVTGGSETTLLAAQAGFFTDLIYLMAANNSDAACSLDIRAVTGGNVMATLQLPANGTVGFSLPVPIPADATGNNWTIDGPDETGRTITVTALFSKEV